MSRTIPGAIDVEGREFLYVEVLAGESFPQLLDDMLSSCPDVPLPEAGGAIEEKARIILRDGTPLLAISYKGDLPGWRTKLISYCEAKGRMWGVPADRRLSLSDGTALPLADCVVIFDQ
jgi:hypothetical protein